MINVGYKTIAKQVIMGLAVLIKRLDSLLFIIIILDSLLFIIIILDSLSFIIIISLSSSS